MNAALDKKIVCLCEPQAIVNNSAMTIAAVDTLGYDQAEIVVTLGATDIALTVAKVTECETSGGSYTDIVGTRMGTDNKDTGVASVLPSATDDNKLYSFLLNMRGGRKRYLQPAVTIGNGSTGGFVTVHAILTRAKISPVSAVDAGYAQRLSV